MHPLAILVILSVVIPAAGLLAARALVRRGRGAFGWALLGYAAPLAAMLALLLAAAWLAAPSESHWLGEPKHLAPWDAFLWSMLLHLAVAGPGLALYVVVAPLFIRRWRRAARPAPRRGDPR